MNYENEIDKIVDRIFRKVNNDGVGFLTTEMDKCKADMKVLVKNLTIPIVSFSEAELCSKPNCNRPKLDSSPLCSYHFDIANS